MVGPVILPEAEKGCAPGPSRKRRRRSALFPDERKAEEDLDSQCGRIKGAAPGPGSETGGRVAGSRSWQSFTSLRQICCDPALCLRIMARSAKPETCMELVQSDGTRAGHNLLLFSQFTSMLDVLIAGRLQEKNHFYMLTGATPRSGGCRWYTPSTRMRSRYS